MRFPWRRRRWQTPAGFFTPFGSDGDPVMDRPGRREEIYARLFSTKDGRDVLADILALAGIARPDFEPGVDRDDAVFRSGVKAGALSIARTAGLDTGALGRALIAGKLEAMTHATQTLHDPDADPAAADD
jgi:hypothetical protein